jgi:hypothetical protein
MIDGVDSERNTVGQTFAASLDEAVLIQDSIPSETRLTFVLENPVRL